MADKEKVITDKEFLLWLYAHLLNTGAASPDTDYMKKLWEVANRI